MHDNDAIPNTERLALRRFELADAQFIVRLLNEESFLHFIGDKGVRCIRDAEAYLTNGPIASYQENGFGLLHVTELATGQSAGMCGLLRRDRQEYPDIGFAFLQQYRERGYAYESAKAVMEFARNSIGIDTIVAFVNPDNERSIRLLERLGLNFTGEKQLDGLPETQRMYSNGSGA